MMLVAGNELRGCLRRNSARNFLGAPAENAAATALMRSTTAVSGHGAARWGARDCSRKAVGPLHLHGANQP